MFLLIHQALARQILRYLTTYLHCKNQVFHQLSDEYLKIEIIMKDNIVFV